MHIIVSAFTVHYNSKFVILLTLLKVQFTVINA